MTSKEKLVRDKIPQLLTSQGVQYTTKLLKEDERLSELLVKLQEEVDELKADLTFEEIADVLEVLFAIGKELGASEEHLCEVRKKKKEERGAFTQGIVMTLVTSK